MDIHRLASSVIVRAPAKINLFFEILAKRSDGFHEIETLMVPVDLFDTLVASPLAADAAHPAGTIELNCRWAPGAWRRDADSLGVLPPAEDNLVTKAVRLLARRAGVEQGLSLELVKRIPSAAGLGGGSSDAAAALAAANLVWELGWSREELSEVAAELGSDVPFFLGRGAAICRGRGEQIEPVDGLGQLAFVLVRPPAGLATADVYRRAVVSEPARSVEPLLAALRAGNPRRWRDLIHNQLEPAARGLSPWVDTLQQTLAGEDCLAARMSGSGTSYFGICRHARHAQRVARRLQARGVGQVFAVTTSN